MTHQLHAPVRPERLPGGAGSGVVGAVGLEGPGLTGRPPARGPRPGWQQRVAGWRARNWRRAILAWFVLSLAVVAVAAEPAADFPQAQIRSVPAVRMAVHVAGAVTAAGLPVVLIALP